MSQKKDLPIAKITRLADDIRLIQDFAENHNFDSGLFSASVIPSKNRQNNPMDIPLISLIIALLVLAILIGFFKFFHGLSDDLKNFLFLIGILVATFATISTHLRFQDKIVTVIMTVGLFLFLFIGSGIFTPEEAVTKIENMK